jgi:hypothetical protein
MTLIYDLFNRRPAEMRENYSCQKIGGSISSSLDFGGHSPKYWVLQTFVWVKNLKKIKIEVCSGAYEKSKFVFAL